MKKKWVGILITIFLTVMLVACGSSNDSENASGNQSDVTSDHAEEKETNTQENDTEEQNTAEVNEESNEKEAEVFRSSSEDGKKPAQQAENLFDSEKVFFYDNDSVEIKLSNASFVKEFSVSNPNPDDTWASRSILADSEIYLHITGTINNDTTDRFHYGHKLAPVKFYLFYDGKHEFESLAATEEENGTKFGGASVAALTEGKVHIYFKVPKPVSETDKPLVLKVVLDEETFEVPLR